MSQVITIKRGTGSSQLTPEEWSSVVREDASLSGGDSEPILWNDPISGEERYINVEPDSGELWTDDIPSDEEGALRLLEKLRALAEVLGAGVSGEDGIEFPEQHASLSPRLGCTSVIACAFSLIVVVALTYELFF